MSYFVQPEIAIEYFKLTGGRHQPVHKLVWLDPFWQNTQDPYLATATKIITTGQTHLSPESYNPAYSQVLAKNIWGQALTQVIVNKVSAEQAADNAIAQIKKIFTEWDN